MYSLGFLFDASRQEKIMPLVDRAEKSAKAVMGQQKILTQIGSALRLINRQSSDLLETAGLGEIVKTCVERFGALDALVNNASAFYATPVGAISAANWDDLVGANLKAPLFLAQAAAPHLKRTAGCIVNITDIHAERPLKNYVVYSIAKAGLDGLTKSLARELGPEVRVNAVAPGPIAWPEDGSFDEVTRQRVISHTLLKRIGEPDDIARAVYYLIAEAPYVTGQIIAVDGGRSANL